MDKERAKLIYSCCRISLSVLSILMGVLVALYLYYWGTCSIVKHQITLLLDTVLNFYRD